MTSYDVRKDADSGRSGESRAILGPFHGLTAALTLAVIVLLAPIWAPLLGLCWLLDRRAARTWRRIPTPEGVGATSCSSGRRASRLTGARRTVPSSDVGDGGDDLPSPPPAGDRGGLVDVLARHGLAGLYAMGEAIAATTRDGTERIGGAP